MPAWKIVFISPKRADVVDTPAGIFLFYGIIILSGLGRML